MSKPELKRCSIVLLLGPLKLRLSAARRGGPGHPLCSGWLAHHAPLPQPPATAGDRLQCTCPPVESAACEEAVYSEICSASVHRELGFSPEPRLPQEVLDFLAWGGHDVAGARLVRSQPREALQLHRTLAEAGVTNMETLVVEAG